MMTRDELDFLRFSARTNSTIELIASTCDVEKNDGRFNGSHLWCISYEMSDTGELSKLHRYYSANVENVISIKQIVGAVRTDLHSIKFCTH